MHLCNELGTPSNIRVDNENPHGIDRLASGRPLRAVTSPLWNLLRPSGMAPMGTLFRSQFGQHAHLLRIRGSGLKASARSSRRARVARLHSILQSHAAQL